MGKKLGKKKPLPRKRNKISKAMVKYHKKRREALNWQDISENMNLQQSNDNTSMEKGVSSSSSLVAMDDFVNYQLSPQTCDDSDEVNEMENVVGTSTLPSEERDNVENDDKSEYNFEDVTPKDYTEINQHVLETEKKPNPANFIEGNRVVDINHTLRWALHLQKDHSNICSGVLVPKKEYRRGLVSNFTFVCNNCEREYMRSTFPIDSNINEAFVWGTLAIGSTYGHSEELLSVMNIPTPSNTFFYKMEDKLGKIWHNTLWNDMENAGQSEKALAIEKNNVDKNGIPFITVYLDGGWSKRSYGHSFDANSGVAVIIGKETCKVLFIGIRNKYCSICETASNKGLEVKQHTCFKNWNLSSSAMESDIIVEGFNCSEAMHGVRYKYFIADGDSSVFTNIKKKVSYGQEVYKIECANHAIKNYGKRLYAIKNDTKNIPIGTRKLLKMETIKMLTGAAKRAIYQNSHGSVEQLGHDLFNTISHVFGDHKKCFEHFCPSVGTIDENSLLPEIRSSGLYGYIFGALELLIKKKGMLIDNETNNRAEMFMNILARFNMGKRLNLVARGSFLRRSYLSALRYNNSFSWHSDAWKKATNKSPGKYFKQYIFAKQKYGKSKICTTKRRQNKKVIKRKLDFDYGPSAEQPALSTEELESASKRILDSLEVTREEIINIASTTIGQYDNKSYISHKRNRLTASVFGQVCRRKPTTPCHSLVKQILHPSNPQSSSLEYGKIFESVAKSKFSHNIGKQIVDAGLYIHPEHNFLAASPDGLIGEDDLVEIKCLFKLSKKMTAASNLEDFIDGSSCLGKQPDGTIKLKRNHNYYYQVQGQLECTNRSRCYFVVFINDEVPLYVEEILRDRDFWYNNMLENLIKFYVHCIVPELVLNRIGKQQKCQDPSYILEAIKTAALKKEKKQPKNC